MFSVLLYDTNLKELEEINKVIKDIIATAMDEPCYICKCYSGSEVATILQNLEILDLTCFDITGESGILHTEGIRKRYLNAEILLLADTKMSPVIYMRPSIMASSLILKPFTVADTQVLQEFVDAFIEKRLEKSNDKIFALETQEGIINIPFLKIFYFEAKNKKVSVRLRNEEYTFYDTLDNLEKQLPDNFLRCHRGFIVNTLKITKLLFAQNLIILEKDFNIPVSRSYKGTIKGIMKNS